MKIIPIYAQLNTLLVYNNSIEASKIDKIPYDKPSVQQLNQANTQFKFHYTGDFSYLFTSPDTGFIIRSRFCTKDNNATNMNSNITHAFNWFGYLFDNVQLRLGGQTIEHIHNPGIVMDTFSIWKIMNSNIKIESLLDLFQTLILRFQIQ